MPDKVISRDWDRWSLVILVLLALVAGFITAKVSAGYSLIYGILLIACMAGIVLTSGYPKGVRIGLALVGLVVGLVLGFL
jgi:uncharacterized membrane protein AbrB (regulator of aidB expression)